MMRYLVKMLACFAVSMYLIVTANSLAESGKPVSAYLLGLVVFGLFVYMAAESAKAEREARNAAQKESTTISISPGKAIINGKLYDIPAQTYRPEDVP